MRAGGINWVAVLAAAAAIYALGFVIYALVVPPESWMAMSGVTEEDIAVGMSRMMFSPLMPIMTAVFLAVLFKWGRVDSLATGARWGAVVALASAVPAMLYGWVYAGNSTDITLLDTAHLLLGHVFAGAILGGWR